MSVDVVQKLWGFCHTLRHEGVNYGDYIEQVTLLLFLKMADERGIELPTYKTVEVHSGRTVEISCDWPTLTKFSGSDLIEHYDSVLKELGKQHGILGEIFAGSQNRLRKATSFKQFIGVIDETDWTSLDVDVKAAAFEGLLEKAAAEGKKGAGQFFTPRLLIQTMVRCVQPDPRVSKSFAIGDPAVGTGGFLVAAYEWLLHQTGGAFERQTAKRIRTKTYFGTEIDERPRRLALMNLYLHQVEPHISNADSIYEAPSDQRFDVILTNPPFGVKGANQAPDRDDFVVQTSNKQLNFLQHILTILKPGGRVAVVVPDNVLFAQQAGEIFKVLMEDCDLHTVLRCPRGTFSPYTEGTQTNVLFFTKGRPTERTWIYDARANVPKVTKKSRPLTQNHFAEFERCYGSDPNGLGSRTPDDSPTGRWRSFSIAEVKAHHYKLDAFKWLRDDELTGGHDLVDPLELITEAMGELQLALDELGDLQALLDAGEESA
ncbi:N-6 DNA methylase [Geodermatophilus sp. SYSU D01176]